MGQWRTIGVVLVISVAAMVHVSDATDKTFGRGNEIDEYVFIHNQARAVLNLPPLVYDEQLAKDAQEWANIRTDCTLTHTTEAVGENLGYGWNSQNITSIVQMWLDERVGYDICTNTCSQDPCGHYTQAVWKNTEKVGCGRSQCPPLEEKKFFICCRYLPPGNVIGQSPY